MGEGRDRSRLWAKVAAPGVMILEVDAAVGGDPSANKEHAANHGIRGFQRPIGAPAIHRSVVRAGRAQQFGTST